MARPKLTTADLPALLSRIAAVNSFLSNHRWSAECEQRTRDLHAKRAVERKLAAAKTSDPEEWARTVREQQEAEKHALQDDKELTESLAKVAEYEAELAKLTAKVVRIRKNTEVPSITADDVRAVFNGVQSNHSKYWANPRLRAILENYSATCVSDLDPKYYEHVIEEAGEL